MLTMTRPARRFACVNCGRTVTGSEVIGPVTIVVEAAGRRHKKTGCGCPGCYRASESGPAVLREDAPRRTRGPSPGRGTRPGTGPFPCSSCAHGVLSAKASGGWECGAAKMMDCRPWSGAIRFEHRKEATLGS